jgi:hypothetical protein
MTFCTHTYPVIECVSEYPNEAPNMTCGRLFIVLDSQPCTASQTNIYLGTCPPCTIYTHSPCVAIERCYVHMHRIDHMKCKLARLTVARCQAAACRCCMISSIRQRHMSAVHLFISAIIPSASCMTTYIGHLGHSASLHIGILW